MSLRQRGQRASESTNEGSSGGGYNTSPSPSATGGGYGYGAAPSSGGVNINSNPYGGGGGGGYYGASPASGSSAGGGSGYMTSPTASTGGGASTTPRNYGAATTPRGYPNASASAGSYGGAYNTISTGPAVTSPYAASNNSNNMSSGYPASPAYNTGGYGSPMYGNTVSAAGGGTGYGNYSNNNNIAADTTTTIGSSPNPFHISKKKSFNLSSITSNILPLLLGLTICTLTATTIHFRRTMQQTYTQIELSKQTIQQHHKRSTQKFQLDHEKADQERADLLKNNERIKDQVAKLTLLHKEMSTKHSHKIDELNAKEIEKQAVLKKIDHMKYQLEDTKADLDKYTSMLSGKVEVEEYSKKREKALWDVVGRLESKIGRESWREAEEW
eukprot:scaffold4650_cov189-Skeletonema_menzelii.AAC.2